MNQYFKRCKTPNCSEFVEMSEDSWLSITLETNKAGEYQFTIFKVSHTDDGYDGWWWKNPNRKIDKEEFDAIKFNFFNWIDQNLQ